MHFFDNHNHSEFSFDGKRASIEKCARAAYEKGLSGIAFTDHCDFFVPAMKAEHEDFASEVFDVKGQQAEIDRVTGEMADGPERGQLKILKGIEIGMHEDHHEDIRSILSGHSFDQVIASVHYLEDTDPFYGGYYEDKDWKTAYGHYLESIWKEMTWLKDFDILGHFDYIVRYAPYQQTCLRYRDFSDILDEILKFLVQEGKALEINTKSYQDYQGRIVTPDPEVFKRYRSLGGEIISFGSDSHDPSRIGHDFGHFASLMKSLGFRWSAHYEKRRLIQTPLEA